MTKLEKISNEFFIKGTLNDPFKFFEDLIFYDSFKKIKDSFYIQTIITKDYKLVINVEQGHEAWHKKDDLSEIMNYVQYFKEVLNYSSKIALECLKSKLKSQTSLEEKKLFIVSQLNLLVSCVDKNTTDFKNELNNIVEQKIFNLISIIKFKYFYLIENHRAFKELLFYSKKIDSIFQPKLGLKRRFFKDLYDSAINLNLIDDEVVPEEVFIQVFTIKNLPKDYVIVFIKKSNIVAHFLKMIEPFFNNFNRTTIGKSQRFLNKQNKPLNNKDLYAAKSRGKGKNIDELNRITDDINKLKPKYLL